MTQEQAYESVRLLIYRICHQHRRRRGGDFDDLLSEANMAFMWAYARYEERPQGCSLVQWVGYVVRHQLMEGARIQAKWTARHTPLQGEVKARRLFSAGTLFAELCEDGRCLLTLALAPPADVEVSAAVNRCGSRADDVRAAIREYLEDWGWEPRRIAEAFGAVRVALAE